MLDLETLIRYIGPKDSSLCRAVSVALALVESDLKKEDAVACLSDVEKLSRLADEIRNAAKQRGITYTVPRLVHRVGLKAEYKEKEEEVLRRIQYNALGYIVEAVRYACAERAQEVSKESIGLV